MKKLFIICSLALLASCSSDPYKKERNARDITMQHISQKPEALDGEFDARFKKSGKDGTEMFAVGVTTGSLDDDEYTLLARSEFKAKVKLTQAAPSEYKSMVQQTIGDSVGGEGRFDKADIAVTEVRALTGFHSDESDKECKRFSEPTVSGDYRFRKECRVIVRIPLVRLEAAFKYTLNSKYGVKEVTLADKLMPSN